MADLLVFAAQLVDRGKFHFQLLSDALQGVVGDVRLAAGPVRDGRDRYLADGGDAFHAAADFLAGRGEEIVALFVLEDGASDRKQLFTASEDTHY